MKIIKLDQEEFRELKSSTIEDIIHTQKYLLDWLILLI